MVCVGRDTFLPDFVRYRIPKFASQSGPGSIPRGSTSAGKAE